MSKKWMTVVGVVAILAIALGATLFLMSRKTSSPITPNSSTTSSTTSTGTSSGTSSTASTGNGSRQGHGSTTAPSSTTGTAPSNTTANGPETNSALPALRPFPSLPDPGITAPPTSPVAPGQTLPNLTDAPNPTVSALKLGAVPDGAQYTITMRPYGIGPPMTLGSRLAIRVDSANPVGGAPANSKIVNANLLAVADTTHGGKVTKGGTYTATLTFRSDGTKMLPILSAATAK